LQSDRLPFFVPVPNSQSGTGGNRDCWVPRPYFVSPSPFAPPPTPAQEKTYHLRKQCFRFIGQLIGLAMRSKQLLALHLPSIIWKAILGHERDINMRSVEEIDVLSANLIADMRQESEKLRGRHVATSVDSAAAASSDASDSSSSAPPISVSPSTFLFDAVFREMTFEVIAADGRSHLLRPNGQSIGLSSSNWNVYHRLLQEFRLHEFDGECREIRLGLASVVPPSWLQLLSWRELKYSVVGSGTIDVEILQKMTTVEGTLKDSVTIKYFWNVLKTRFTPEQQAQFVSHRLQAAWRAV
jgi:hypothetical protein